MNNQDRSMQVAAVQMVSGMTVADNLIQAEQEIEKAVASGAALVALPEYFCFMGKHDADKLPLAEPPGNGPIQSFLSDQARRHGIWLVGGTLPLRSPDAGRVYNTCLVYDPEGRVSARYDKIHLFSFQRGQESYDESRAIRPGDDPPQVFDTPFGRTALGICYDLRFPEFFRAQGDVRLMVLPAAFTWTTGSVHWEVLLRARAIENQCYVLASAQGGVHANGRRTWGHSMLIDPWGEILDCLPEGPGMVAGRLDADRLETVRASLPALRHRVLGSNARMPGCGTNIDG
ncbi:MAG: carbon-nitrogen hydrolase family protein [Castellaniella sp.]|uniref:carbon-nitrogen hydrolase family protein n=1 Tax=Castellaniella sp. TaxID=1955812 RepID=UPI002A358D83|nr:carbon-nitrogen hydrolase family protein [Castellaniella sp.]MDY0309926.1 carbon-nitrogen hydrolase family protein [Castellaniella sp.]